MRRGTERALLMTKSLQRNLGGVFNHLIGMAAQSTALVSDRSKVVIVNHGLLNGIERR
jgi:hypothetical protein